MMVRVAVAGMCLSVLGGCGGEGAALPDGGRSPDAGPVSDRTMPRADGGGLGEAGADGATGLPVDEPCESPGTLETVPCGQCGTVDRFCTSAGTWEYGSCEGESGVCRPGARREAECGACGTRSELCTTECVWEAAGECTDEGACMPGELVRSREGCEQGQRDLRCDDACTFEPVSECALEECDTPGATEDVECGTCGVRTRFCTSDGEWEYGPCEAQGECEPGTRTSETCGLCGTQEIVCSDSCQWRPFGSCTDEGECSPGTTTHTSDGCPDGETRSRRCNDSCEYEPAGMCAAEAAGLGDSCAERQCEAGLDCVSDTGTSVCRQPCAENQVCTHATAQCVSDHCTDQCALFSDEGCPAGAKCDYLGFADDFGLQTITICSGVGSHGQGASCTRHADCARGFGCFLHTESSGTCRQLCDDSHPCPAGFTCDALAAPFPGFATLGTCAPEAAS